LSRPRLVPQLRPFSWPWTPAMMLLGSLALPVLVAQHSNPLPLPNPPLSRHFHAVLHSANR